MFRLTACVIAVATIVSIGAGFAHEFKKGSIAVEHPWSPATPGGAQVATGYLTIENDGAEPDRLISATAEIAGHTGIHQMSMVDGVMKMRELTHGLTVPADGSVKLEPNSYHLMFTDLKQPLKEGDEFSGILIFERAGAIDVSFEVEGIGAGGPTPDEQNHH
jgi:copper(I)-binding protein